MLYLFNKNFKFCNDPKFSDIQVWVNSADPVQLICVFVFAYEKSRFSYDAAYFMF